MNDSSHTPRRCVRPARSTGRRVAIIAITLTAALVPISSAAAEPAPRTTTESSRSAPQRPSRTGTEQRRERLEALANALGQSVDDVRSAVRAARAAVEPGGSRRARRRAFVTNLAEELGVEVSEVRGALRAVRASRVTVR